MKKIGMILCAVLLFAISSYAASPPDYGSKHNAFATEKKEVKSTPAVVSATIEINTCSIASTSFASLERPANDLSYVNTNHAEVSVSAKVPDSDSRNFAGTTSYRRVTNCKRSTILKPFHRVLKVPWRSNC